MRLIDEKGRLFGKINIIDFFALMLLLVFIPMLYIGYRVISSKSPIKPEKQSVEVNCRFIKVTPDMLKLIKVGDKEVDASGETIGEITWLGEVRPYQYQFDVGQGEMITKDDLVLKEVYARIKFVCEAREKRLFYKNAVIDINSNIDFKTDKYTIWVIPLMKELGRKESVDIEVNCKFIKVSPETLKLIKVGDKEVDASGETIGEITWLGEVRPYQYQFDLGQGQTLAQDYPGMKEILAKLKLNVEVGEIEDSLSYKNERLIAEFPIKFTTKKYAAQVLVTKRTKLQEKWIKIKVKSLGVVPELAAIIKDGDIETDPVGKTVGVLREILTNRPSEMLAFQDNQWMAYNHPYLKDIIFAFDILCHEKDGVLYFKNYPVKVGNSITFATELYSASGTITDLIL